MTGMKGVIVDCLQALVSNKFGKDKWMKALEMGGYDPKRFFLVTEDIEDAKALRLVDSVCKVLNISLSQAADAFGEYWVCEYAPKIYKAYYQGALSAKDFLLKMDEVHRLTTLNIPNAQPPRFKYEWLDNKTMVMKYESKRGLIDFLVGLVKGVGKYYKENLLVSKVGNASIKVVFSK
jgi:Haem-NO-binding